MLPLVFRFPSFSAALVYSDIAAVCCDSRIVRWQDGIAPYTISVLLSAALKTECAILPDCALLIVMKNVALISV